MASGVTLMERVALLLVFQHACVCGAELCLVERIAEAFACLCHFLLYLLVVFCYLVLDEHIGTIAFL